MLPTTPAYSCYSSSPPSSPFESFIDSSPPSSPSPGPIIVDPQASPTHPFAASTHANRRPPHYEKKNQSSSRNSSERKPKFRYVPLDRNSTSSFEDNDLDVSDNSNSFIECDIDFNPEQELWDRTISSAIDNADGKIDLSDHRLTFIPPNISDLASLVVLSSKHTSVSKLHTAYRVPTRVATSMMTGPGRAAQRVRSLATARTTSAAVFASATDGTPPEEIHLYLGKNAIRFLPNELFNLTTLVVLSLRGNSLQELPPLVGQLINLRELNLSLNQLSCLPSEIQNLHLTSLVVHPNPFYPQPLSGPNDKDVPISETYRCYGQIPPLTELALRILMAPSPIESSGIPNNGSFKTEDTRTQFEMFYELPLSLDWNLSPPVEQILTSCVPNCISSNLQRTRSRSYGACISTCSGMCHRNLKPDDYYKRPVFINHAEEKFTWEAEVAGVRVALGGSGGRIPIRWRGCQWGCLDYLDPRLEQPVDQMVMDLEMSIPTVTDGEDMVMETQFSSNGFEFDDEE